MVVHAPLGRALLAGLLVLVGLGSVVATTQEPGTSGDQLDLPAIRVGDLGQYTATLEYADGTSAGLQAGHWASFRFQWRAPTVRLDAEGQPHAVHVVETYAKYVPGTGSTGEWSHWSTDAATAETISEDQRWSDGGSSTSVVSGNWTTEGNQTVYGRGAPLCGLRSEAFGTRHAAEDDLWAQGGCTADVGEGPSVVARFVHEGRDVIDGRSAHRYAAADGVPVRLWYASGIAAPVQVLQPAVAQDEVRDLFLRLRLVAWEPGDRTEELPGADAVLATAASPLDWVGYDRDRGLAPPAGHPFPHTAALEIAELDPRSGLATFRQSHPDAYLQLAYTTRASTQALGADERFTWSLQFTDGLDHFEVTVSQTSPRDDLFPGVSTPVPVRVQVSGTETGTGEAWLGTWEEVPAWPLATVPSVAARWEALSGEKVPQDFSYGFGWWCQQAGCETMRGWTYVGDSEREDSPLGSLGRTDQLLVDADGGNGLVRRYRADTTYQSSLAAGLPGSQPAPIPETPPAAPATIATDWFLSPAGAGTFAAAFIVAVLTYLWPSLKQGAAGLFSRLAPEELASHPARQAILDALAAEPGIHFQALCRKLGKGRGVVGHHLSKLVDGGQVLAKRQGGFVCYFLAGQRVGNVAAVTATKAEGAQRLLDLLGQRPGLSGLELAQASGLSPSTVHYHLRRLQGAGLVMGLAQGRSLTMHLTADGHAAWRRSTGVEA